jgi:hypothetical protein
MGRLQGSGGAAIDTYGPAGNAVIESTAVAGGIYRVSCAAG